MAVPDEGFKLNVGGHLLEDSGSGITKIFEYVGKTSATARSPRDMPVWDHEKNRWGSIRDRYSGDKDELKKVIKALLETPYEELDEWDDRPLREWMLQHTSDQGVIDLWEFLAVLECLTDEWYDHSATDNLYVRKMHYAEKRMAGYSFWPEQGWDGMFQDLARRGHRERRRGAAGDAASSAVVIENGEVKGVALARAAADPPERVLRGRGARGRRRDLHAAGLERAARRARVGAARLVRRRRSGILAQDHLRIAWLGLYLARRGAGRGDRPQGARDLAAHAEEPRCPASSSTRPRWTRRARPRACTCT